MAKAPRINLNRIRKLVGAGRFIFSYHAKERAFQRGITTDQTISTILYGEIIETFDDEKPCPKAHIEGFIGDVICHVIVAECKENIVIITVYISEEDN